MSEKSTRKAPTYAVESRSSRNRSVFRQELQLCVAILLKSGINRANQGRKRRFLINNACDDVLLYTVAEWKMG